MNPWRAVTTVRRIPPVRGQTRDRLVLTLDCGHQVTRKVGSVTGDGPVRCDACPSPRRDPTIIGVIYRAADTS